MLRFRQFTPWLLIAGLLLLSAGWASAETDLADSPMGQIAAKLRPGDWTQIDTALPKGISSLSDLFRVRVDDGRLMSIDGWTDSAHWDPVRRKTFFIGMRKYKKFISYDVAANRWQVLGWEGDAPPHFERLGHVYGRTALDWKRGHYYWLSPNRALNRYVIDDARWEVIPNVPIRGYISMEWHETLDVLVAINRGGQRVVFRPGETEVVSRSVVDGYHSVGRYNRKRGDMLFAGGNKSRRLLELFDKEGKVQRFRDAPIEISIQNTSLTYDPESGNYLFILRRERELHEFSPELDEWRLAKKWSEGEWPFGKHGFYTPIVIDELGVIFWQSGEGNYVYRHATTFSNLR